MVMEREEIIKIFAANLREKKKKKRYTLEKLAEMADITPEYLARIESEKYSPSLVVIVNLALALEISVEKLVSSS